MTREDIIEGLNKVENELYLKYGDENLANQIHNISEALRLNQLSLPPAEDADDLKQYMTNLLYSAYDKGAKQVEPSESDRKDLDQWVEEMINGIDEYFKSKQPTAEGAEKILEKHCHLQYNQNTGEREVCSSVSAVEIAMQEFAALHAQRLAEKMVSERLRKELMMFGDYFNNLDPKDHILVKDIDEYLKSKEQ